MKLHARIVRHGPRGCLEEFCVVGIALKRPILEQVGEVGLRVSDDEFKAERVDEQLLAELDVVVPPFALSS